MSSRQHVERRASEWIARRDSQNWTADQQSELTAWLQSSTAHQVEFLRLEAAWDEANRLKAMGAGVQSGVVPTLREWRASPFFKHRRPEDSAGLLAPLSRHRHYFRYGVAATVLLAVGAMLWSEYGLSGNQYSTPTGGIALIPVEDGSKVTLSSDSRVRIDLSPSQRRIELQQGEAFFDVAKDPSRPFVVQAGEQRVVAVGTRFSVRREGDDIRVVVTEGAVKVERAAAQETLLPAGSMANTRHAVLKVQNKPVPELEEVLSWRTGYVVFHATALHEAVAEFNRYNTRKIVVDDPELANIPVSGNFRATNVDAFVRLLQGGFDIKTEQRGERIILTQ